MHADINLPKVIYDGLMLKVGMKSFYTYLKDFGCGQISLYHYIDHRGDFTESKYKRDLIAMAIYKLLPAKQKMQVQEYISMEF